MTPLKLQDYSIHELLKRCRRMEASGYECVRRIMQEGEKFTVVYRKVME